MVNFAICKCSTLRRGKMAKSWSLSQVEMICLLVKLMQSLRMLKALLLRKRRTQCMKITLKNNPRASTSRSILKMLNLEQLLLIESQLVQKCSMLMLLQVQKIWSKTFHSKTSRLTLSARINSILIPIWTFKLDKDDTDYHQSTLLKKIGQSWMHSLEIINHNKFTTFHRLIKTQSWTKMWKGNHLLRFSA